ncbi:glycosyltransferase family 4 protein [Deinococcus radiophilus]|uniref:glycosyltransferase family 4 protein n=1 Tax=Deinococcus radiophilus TaxID=32062 RepID=UPI0036128D87
MLARRFRVPFVMEVRDIWPKTLTDLGGMSEKHPLIMVFAALEKFLYRRSDAVMSLLQGAGEHIQAVAGRKVPLIWIPNGVDTALFGAAQAFPAGKFRAVYAGAHGLANSLDTLIEAAEILQRGGHDLEIQLVGDGPDKPRLKELAASKGIKNVIFSDPVPKAEMGKVLAGAHACIMPLLNSPVFEHGVSPNKLFDYLASERPVIFAINTSYNAVDQAQAGITIPPEDPQALADALLRLSRLPESERRAMGERGRAYVEEHHDMRRLARRLGNALWVLSRRNS